MNKLIILSVLFALCYVANGDSNCTATVTAFPPDPKTGCCGVNTVKGDKTLDGVRTIAYVDEDPWVVLIEYVKDDVVTTPCSGALISGRYVLTAGHCVTGSVLLFAGKPYRIYLGEYDIDNEGIDCMEYHGGEKECTKGADFIPIEKTIPHPEYNQKEFKNDIGLIKMTHLVDFIHPICLPSTDITQETGAIFFSKSGWGNLEGQKPVSVKQHVLVPFVPRNKCQEVYNKFGRNRTLLKDHICAGGGNVKDFCKGSGLPLAFNSENTYEVTGIVSFGVSVCTGKIPTVYTNVYEYISWIKSNIVA